MGLTRQEIVDRVCDLIGDDSTTMQAMIVHWINDVYREVWHVDPNHGPLWTVTMQSVVLSADVSSYSVSATSPRDIIAAKVEGYYGALWRRSQTQIVDERYYLREVGSGVPRVFDFRRTFGATENAYIDLYPAPDSSFAGKTLYFRQTAAFSPLDTSASVPNLPDEFQVVLVDGAAYRAALNTVEPVATAFAQMYERGKKNLLLFNLSLIPDTAEFYGEPRFRELK